MTAANTGTVPKIGDRVRMDEQPGLYDVVDVNLLMQTVNLKSIDGAGHVTRNVAWTSLKPQSAAAR
jgi:hypothetical protein